MDIKTMKSWVWLPLVVASALGMSILYGVAALLPMQVKNLFAAGILTLAACATLLLIYALLSRLIEKRPIRELDPRRFLPDTAAGWLVGGGAIALSVLVMGLYGVYGISSVSPCWEDIFRDLFLLVVVAVGEEIVCRGILMRMLEERWGTAIALVVSCLLFGFMHYANDGASVWSSIAIAITATEAASFLYSRTLWMPIGCHFAWNFVQGDIFGIAVSGETMNGSLIQPVITGPDLLTGGRFGAEASIITVVIATAIAAGLVILAVRKGNYVPFRCPWRRQG